MLLVGYDFSFVNVSAKKSKYLRNWPWWIRYDVCCWDVTVSIDFLFLVIISDSFFDTLDTSRFMFLRGNGRRINRYVNVLLFICEKEMDRWLEYFIRRSNIVSEYCDDGCKMIISQNNNWWICCYLPRNVVQIYSDIWFPDLDSEKWLSSLLSIRLNWKYKKRGINYCELHWFYIIERVIYSEILVQKSIHLKIHSDWNSLLNLSLMDLWHLIINDRAFKLCIKLIFKYIYQRCHLQ